MENNIQQKKENDLETIIKAVEEKNYSKAEKIGNKKEYLEDAEIQFEIMKLAMKRQKNAKAEAIGEKEAFKDCAKIQSLRITLATRQNNFEKAKEIGYREIFKNNEVIQSQLITIAIKERKLEEAIKIGEREEFKDCEYIQIQMMVVAMIRRDFKKAEEIGLREEWANSKSVQKKMKQVEILKLRKDKWIKEQQMKKRKYLAKIKTMLYCDKIGQEIIDEVKENKDLSDWEKTYVLLAIYEKINNLKAAERLIKQYRKDYGKTIDDKKFNFILQKLKNKKATILDYGFYDDILKWNFDKNLLSKFEEEKESVKFRNSIKVENVIELKRQNNPIINEKVKKCEELNKT